MHAHRSATRCISTNNTYQGSAPKHLAALTCLLFVAACTTAAKRKAAEDAQATKEVSQEVDRICHLPPAERDAEVEKLKKESGVVLYCGDDKAGKDK